MAPDMWRRITNPDLLIYLDVDPKVAAQRENLAEPPSWWREEREVRLAHARRHCDLYLDTSALSLGEVLAQTLTFIRQRELLRDLEDGREAKP